MSKPLVLGYKHSLNLFTENVLDPNAFSCLSLPHILGSAYLIVVAI